tara:strand:+ start:80 stop:2074 length:1995 start_codon:yes stop_codon:yes gene_type:complete
MSKYFRVRGGNSNIQQKDDFTDRPPPPPQSPSITPVQTLTTGVKTIQEINKMQQKQVKKHRQRALDNRWLGDKVHPELTYTYKLNDMETSAPQQIFKGRTKDAKNLKEKYSNWKEGWKESGVDLIEMDEHFAKIHGDNAPMEMIKAMQKSGKFSIQEIDSMAKRYGIEDTIPQVKQDIIDISRAEVPVEGTNLDSIIPVEGSSGIPVPEGYQDEFVGMWHKMEEMGELDGLKTGDMSWQDAEAKVNEWVSRDMTIPGALESKITLDPSSGQMTFDEGKVGIKGNNVQLWDEDFLSKESVSPSGVGVEGTIKWNPSTNTFDTSPRGSALDKNILNPETFPSPYENLNINKDVVQSNISLPDNMKRDKLYIKPQSPQKGEVMQKRFLRPDENVNAEFQTWNAFEGPVPEGTDYVNNLSKPPLVTDPKDYGSPGGFGQDADYMPKEQPKFNTKVEENLNNKINKVNKSKIKFGSKFNTGEGAIATGFKDKISNIKQTFEGVKQGFQHLGNLGQGGAKEIGKQIGSKLVETFGTKTAATAATTGATAATGAAGAATGATASTGVMAAMGPAGWAMMALSLLGGKLFKKHTLLGKIFSDERLKKNIEYVGKSKSGIPIVHFDYIDELNIPGRYVGVLSKDTPQAREVHPAYGFDVVDYNKIDVPFGRIK